MHKLDAEELPALAMENELLRYEVVHLRARLAAAEDAATQAQAAASAALETAAVEAVSEDATARSDDAVRADLVWLLERLDGSPAGRVLRRRPGFGRLVETYLGRTP